MKYSKELLEKYKGVIIKPAEELTDEELDRFNQFMEEARQEGLTNQKPCEVKKTKKVFSIEKFRESMKVYYTPEELDNICADPKWWVKQCEGLTEEEMNKIGYVTEEKWMIEVEDE